MGHGGGSLLSGAGKISQFAGAESGLADSGAGTEVYPEKLTARGLEYVRANAAEREDINRIIFDELVNGVFTSEAIACFQRVIERMKSEGCDGVVLGCTEIPLIMNDSNSALPTLDSTRLLARAALRRAVQSATEST